MLSTDNQKFLEGAYLGVDLNRSEPAVMWPNSRDEPVECEGLHSPGLEDEGITPHLSFSTQHLI